MVKKQQLSNLRWRIGYTLFILFIYILGNSIPVPFVRVTQTFHQMLNHSPISIVSFLGGANLARLSVFSVGLNPFMIAMMIVQLLTMMRLFGADTLSQHQMMIAQQWLSLVLAIVQSTALVYAFKLTANFWQSLAAILIFTAGSMFVLWMGLMNMQFGIGGTMTLILFNIISSSINPLVHSVKQMGRLDNGTWLIVALVVLAVVELVFWVAFSRVYYKAVMININLPSETKPLTLPLALNLGAMMTYMIGMALLMLPLMLTQFFKHQTLFTNINFQIWFCAIMTFVLFYFFTYLQFNPREQAKKMRNQNSYVVDVRPGKPTKNYFAWHWLWICLPGALLNAAQLTFGLVGAQFLGKYTAFALVPINIVMIVMFMKTIEDQLLIMLVPHRYERLMKREG